jgi:ABC-type sugar transport system substrate-binding protein
VVGLDGTPLALQRIREGTQDATVEQSPIAMVNRPGFAGGCFV